MRKPLSLYHPWLYTMRVWQRRLFRYSAWYLSTKKYSSQRLTDEKLNHRYIKHTSTLIRCLGNSDLELQYNKVTNLKLAVESLNGVLIKPNEYFSFCKLVGKPTTKRGFVEGMELSFGEVGGICQLSNLIHWMAIHSPLQVIERANHSVDSGHVLPFGSESSVFYNFVDLVLYNQTDRTFQLALKVGEHQLEGELLCSQESDVKYRVYERTHRFVRCGERVYRQNQIWRDIMTKGHYPQLLSSKYLYNNNVVVKYAVAEDDIADE